MPQLQVCLPALLATSRRERSLASVSPHTVFLGCKPSWKKTVTHNWLNFSVPVCWGAEACPGGGARGRGLSSV